MRQMLSSLSYHIEMKKSFLLMEKSVFQFLTRARMMFLWKDDSRIFDFLTKNDTFHTYLKETQASRFHVIRSFENEALFSFFRGFTSARNHIDDKYYKYTGSNNDNCCPSESMLRLFLQNSSKWNGRRPIVLGRTNSKFELITLKKCFYEFIKRGSTNV